MKPRLHAVALTLIPLLGAPAQDGLDGAIPHPLDRYETIWTTSPFVAVTDLSGQADNLTGRYAITGIARVGESDVVFLFDRTTLERFALEPGKSRGDLTLQGVDGVADIKSARVTLSGGGGTTILAYDPAVVPAPQPVAVAPQAMSGQPGDGVRGRYPGRGAPAPDQQAAQQPGTSNQIVGGAAQPSPSPRRIIRRSRGIVPPQ